MTYSLRRSFIAILLYLLGANCAQAQANVFVEPDGPLNPESVTTSEPGELVVANSRAAFDTDTGAEPSWVDVCIDGYLVREKLPRPGHGVVGSLEIEVAQRHRGRVHLLALVDRVDVLLGQFEAVGGVAVEAGQPDAPHDVHGDAVGAGATRARGLVVDLHQVEVLEDELPIGDMAPALSPIRLAVSKMVVSFPPLVQWPIYHAFPWIPFLPPHIFP